MSDMKGNLATAHDALSFMLAGNATMTLRSLESGNRFTYRVRAIKDKRDWFFVSLMNGPDNESNFAYMGLIRGAHFARTAKSRVAETSVSFRAFEWFWRNLQSDHISSKVECWHEGRCGRCNRKLTVPESISRGIGPECIKHHQVRNHLT